MISDRRLLVTLKTDPDPGTVDVVPLHDGAVGGAVPAAVSAPADTLTPFGFAVYPDGTAVITLAHSSQDGLFRNGAFAAVIDAGQMAPCWMTRAGKYVFTANTGSGTISRLIGTGNHVFVDSPVAASITTGGAPSDIDADQQVLGVIDHGGRASHLSLFTYNRFGELTASGAPIDLGVANANGVAIMAPTTRTNTEHTAIERLRRSGLGPAAFAISLPGTSRAGSVFASANAGRVDARSRAPGPWGERPQSGSRFVEPELRKESIIVFVGAGNW